MMSTAEALPRARGHYRPRTNPNRNGQETRDRILLRCRELMAAGRFRPSRQEVCVSGITRKMIARHFASLGALYADAIDTATRNAILGRLMPNGPWPCSTDCDRIVFAVTVGWLVTP